MKIKREDLPKIIKVLQDKYDSTKEGDIIYNLDFGIEKPKEEFILPDKWVVSCNSDMENNMELFEWRRMTWKNKGYINSDRLHTRIPTSNYTEITYEQFLKYVYNKNL